jgi:hypothetical protein
MTRKTISKKANSKGTVFALLSDGVTWEVWKLCENYSRECAGGIKKTWRYVQKQMSENEARELFNRRVAGAQKA